MTEKKNYLNVQRKDSIELGSKAAQLFAFMKYKSNISKIKIEGSRYIGLAYKEIHEEMSEFSLMTIRRLMQLLIDKKKIEKIKYQPGRHYNPNTNWYRVLPVNETCIIVQNEQIVVQNEQSVVQNEQSVPPQTQDPATDSEPLIKYINKYINNKTPLPPYEGEDVLNNINDIEDKNKDRLKGKNQALADDDTTKLDTQHQPIPQGKSSALKLTQFEKWWDTYNHKVDLKIAFKAYNRAIKRIKPDELQLLTEKYIYLREQLKQEKLKDKGIFVPKLKNPSTWLNNDCWDDERIRNVDLSTPQEKEENILHTIETMYPEREATVRQNICKNMGHGYYSHFFSDAQFYFMQEQVELRVRNSIVQDQLCRYHNGQLKLAFGRFGVNQLIIKNIKQDSEDVLIIT